MQAHAAIRKLAGAPGDASGESRDERTAGAQCLAVAICMSTGNCGRAHSADRHRSCSLLHQSAPHTRPAAHHHGRSRPAVRACYTEAAAARWRPAAEPARGRNYSCGGAAVRSSPGGGSGGSAAAPHAAARSCRRSSWRSCCSTRRSRRSRRRHNRSNRRRHCTDPMRAAARWSCCRRLGALHSASWACCSRSQRPPASWAPQQTRHGRPWAAGQQT